MDNTYSIYFENDNALINELDGIFLNMVKNYKVHTWKIPSLIRGDILQKCGYFESMPHQLTCAYPIIKKEIINHNDYYLTPAACLHIYPELKNIAFNNEIITTLERVYRYENGNFQRQIRTWEFLVREFVAVGTPNFVKKFLDNMKVKSLDLIKELNIKGAIELGNDHFYPSPFNQMAEKYQLNNKLKYELVVDLKQSTKLALASFNYHEFHFSKAFDFDKNGSIVTGCVGFGIDRWVHTLNKK